MSIYGEDAVETADDHAGMKPERETGARPSARTRLWLLGMLVALSLPAGADVAQKIAYKTGPLVAGFIYDNASEGWPSAASMPAGRSSAGYGMWNSNLYVVAGYGAPGYYTNSVYRYDGGSSWTTCAALPFKVVNPGVFALGGSLYCVGGTSPSGTATANVNRYDGSAWSTGTSLPLARHAFACATLGSYAYVIGGADGGGNVVDTVYRFDGTSWTAAASLPQTRCCAIAATLGNTLYLMGGLASGGAKLTSVLKFDGTTWTSAGNMPRWQYYPAVCVESNKIVIVGGMDTSYSSITNIMEFDGTTWTERPGLSSVLANAAAGVVSNRLYVVGGGSANSPSDETRYHRLASTGVTPVSGIKAGGYTVTIMGTGLGSGTDITNVTLCGVAASSISAQSATQVVVTAGVAANGGLGDVRVFSTSCGTTVKLNYFTYIGAICSVYTTNFDFIASGDLPSEPYGTDFGELNAGQSATHEFYVSEDSNILPLNISAVHVTGMGASAFTVLGMPSALETYGYTNFSVRFTPPAGGVYTAAVQIVSDGDPNPFIFNVSGSAAGSGPHTNVVTTLADSGVGSLRQVVTTAGKGDVVAFDPSLAGGTITLTSGQILIANDVDVIGLGTAGITVSGNHACRVFEILAGVNATIEGMTVADGYVTGAPATGGGIYNGGTLTLRQVTVRGSTAAGSNGVASGSAFGGGLCNTGTVTVDCCTFSGNVACGGVNGTTGYDGRGGAIYDAVNRNVTAVNSTFSGNTAQGGTATMRSGNGFGGALCDGNATPDAGIKVLTNCTISGNTALSSSTARGGGCLLTANTVYDHVTVVSNTSSVEGGGIYSSNYSNPSIVNPILRHSIVANNRASYSIDVANNVQSDGYNLITQTDGWVNSGIETGNIYGRDPMLGALADNGGPTFTHLPLAGSPVLDAIPSDAVTTDQRGLVRPQGAAFDIGAVEAIIPVVSPNVGPYVGGNSVTITNIGLVTVTNVLVGGVSATIAGQGANWVTIVLPAIGAAGATDIVVQTSEKGAICLPGMYTVNPAGVIAAVSPQSGSRTGGYSVVISGTNLCNGIDVTGVSLCGVAVSNIVSQSLTQIVVTAAAGAVGVGDVRVRSTSFGETVKSNAFAYVITVDHFAWSAIPSPQTMNMPFDVTVSALDAENNAVTGFVGQAHLAGYIAGSLDDFDRSDSTSLGTNWIAQNGAWRIENNRLMSVATPTSVTAVFNGGSTNYVATADVFYQGSARVVYCALMNRYASSSDNIFVKVQDDSAAGNFNMVYFRYGDNSSSAWAGMTGGSASESVTPFTQARLTTRVVGDTVTLEIDRNFDGVPEDVITRGGIPLAALGNGLALGGYNNAAFDNFGGNYAATISPTNTGAFVDGVWTGAMTVRQKANTLWLSADDGDGHRGMSASFKVQLGSPGIAILGTNGATVANYAAASRAAGTDFGHKLVGSSAVNTLVITNTGTATLTVFTATTNGMGSQAFSVAGLPASLAVGAAKSFTISYAPTRAGSHHAVVMIINNATNYDVSVNGSAVALSKVIGPYAGGNTVTITNGNFGVITNVLVGGVAATITGSGSSWVTITLPATGSAGAKDIVVQTSDNGDIALAGAYTVNPAGVIAAVTPQSGSRIGGYSVVISGTNLCDGADVTGVTLCGVLVSNIVSQSPTQVVVTAAAGTPGTGDVRIRSTNYGETVMSNAFTYLKTDQTVAFPAIAPKPVASVVGLAATATSGLPVSFAVVGGPGSLTDGTNLILAAAGTVTVVASQAGDGFWNPAASVTNRVSVYQLTSAIGPYAGGNTVTITNGNFGTVTNVLVGGVAATITASGSSWVTIMLPATGSAGAKDIVVQTSDNGDIALAGAYTVNPAGVIAAVAPLSGSWSGGYSVAICGANLCDGADVTGVTLCGVAVSNIVSQSPTQIVVTAAAGTVGTGDVRVYSTNYGETLKSNAFTYLKTDQTIAFTALIGQTVSNKVELAATATSGATVTFAVVSGPGVLDGTGTSLSFTAAGRVSVVASQAGDARWNAAPSVTNTFKVVGLVTDVTPPQGIMVGGDAVRIDGLWLGDGGDITSVTLCGVEATIVSQAVHTVWVVTGGTNVTSDLSGPAHVVSGFGDAALENAFVYRVLYPPTALPATQISSNAFKVAWTTVTNADFYVLDVSTTSNFADRVTGYNGQYVGNTDNAWVTGLTDDTWYWYRLRACISNNVQSLNSNVIGVPTGKAVPWVAVSNMTGSASSGTQEFPLGLVFEGTGLTYSVTSDAPAVASAQIDAGTGVLRLTYIAPGTATITVTARHIATGYEVSYSFGVTVAGAPGYGVGALKSSAMETYQVVTVTNSSLRTASGVMVVVSGLDSATYVKNRTSVNGAGNAVIEYPYTLLPNATLELKVIYERAYGTQVTNGRPATVTAHLILEPLQESPPADAIASSVVGMWTREDKSVVIAVRTVPGTQYMIQYRDSLTGAWNNAYPSFTATATVTYWVDSGQPVTDPHPKDAPSRFYQVLTFPAK